MTPMTADAVPARTPCFDNPSAAALGLTKPWPTSNPNSTDNDCHYKHHSTLKSITNLALPCDIPMTGYLLL
jgi:hypothetical protein